MNDTPTAKIKSNSRRVDFWSKIFGSQFCRILVSAVFLCLILPHLAFAIEKRIVIIADGRTIFHTTAAETVEDALKEAGVPLSSVDSVRMTTPELRHRTIVSVYRPVPVRLIIGREKHRLISSLPTIGEFLQMAKIDLDTYRSVLPLEGKLKAGLDIVLVPRSIEEQKKLREDREKKVAAELAAQQAAQRAAEEKAERERRLASGHYIETSRGIERYTAHYVMEATAYLPDVTGTGITATGIPARYGIVAVDPRVIPLGTRLYIPGYGHALAADTGGAIIGNIIDLCYESYDEAIQFGRRNVDVYILAG